jgi:hypothetical protein
MWADSFIEEADGAAAAADVKSLLSPDRFARPVADLIGGESENNQPVGSGVYLRTTI